MKIKNLIKGISISSLMVLSLTSPIFASEQSTYIAYGGGLNSSQIATIRDKFGVDEDSVNETTVTGDDVYTYLGVQYDTSSLVSSVMVKKNTGNGVQVNILTENNITQVTSNQYANAAITAGVSNCEIDVAALTQATGESALTGVYKALELSGETLDTQRTQIAQEELETTNEIAQNNSSNDSFDSTKLDQALVDIKQQLAEIKQNQGTQASTEQIQEIVNEALSKYDLSNVISQNDMNKLINFASQYQNTSAVDSKEVLKQLNKLENQLGSLIDKAQSEGWFDQLKDFFTNLFNQITGSN